ncbi:MAG: transposase IS200-family protein [Candidatus Gottesmanbacteria bacterium GW2011_GWB1_49_7]|uniref:Transposase IS200-family protein n=1 Tax=Candidatus Gottesmanbacteria bacterium GW2011_GWB1_49_7 TaxID=1618448 RepID=A0A0G1W1F9_9BACT|nr:MAG: transposase IS200-family protein [Candidatus Gottesmanbacteria bacterium GW2011_GWB1_49_7]
MVCMTAGYSRSQTSVHFMGYHFIWCPKYRRPVLKGGVDARLAELIKEKATELDCKIIALEIMPDHVHMFIEAQPILSPNKIVGQIKGYSSRVLREEYKHLKTTLPTLWTRSYFVSTHGHISDSLIRKYIEEQKKS